MLVLVRARREALPPSPIPDLVHRLRPELIRKSPFSLSSDVFSLFEEGSPSLEDLHRPVEVQLAVLIMVGVDAANAIVNVYWAASYVFRPPVRC